ncbi:hypothetical protein AWC38_SpisGene24086 [Stylophora pistillata]|uniref:Uncharacterized protein n=1 Tax=Stylophora pistillata TaxID=50429 RepID=A0A2B4R6X3_STYPI|nr:hypothetical protein AWC38_SpisGene24086 [Stylophora pistillata]
MQLSSLKSITKYNVIFEEATTNQHGHQRINIKAKHGLGENKAGPLVVASPFRFSFGVQPSLSKGGDVTGYTLPTPLWNHQEGEPTRKEFEFYNALKELKHICYEHLDEFYGTDVAESIKFPLVEKEGKAPVLYPRLMYSQKTEKIRTLFHSKEESKVEPLECLDYCKVKMTIVVDSIYLGDEYASVQLKVNDVYVHLLPQRQVQPLAVLEEDEFEEEEDFEDEETTYKKDEFGRRRINIKARHGDKTGPLMIATPFDVSSVEPTWLGCNRVGYHMSFPVWSPFEEQTQKQTNFYNALKELKSLCYEYLDKVYGRETAESMNFPMSKAQDQFGFSIVQSFYPKFIYSRKTDKINTLFHTRGMTKVNPLDYYHKHCFAKMTIIVDYIVIDGDDVAVQLKVNDIYVEPYLSRQPLAVLSEDEQEDDETEVSGMFRKRPKSGWTLPGYKYPPPPHLEPLAIPSKDLETFNKLLSIDPNTVPFYPLPAALSNDSESKECSSSSSSSSDSEEEDNLDKVEEEGEEEEDKLEEEEAQLEYLRRDGKDLEEGEEEEDEVFEEEDEGCEVPLEFPWSAEEDLEVEEEEDDPEGCFCTRQRRYRTSTEFLNAIAECKNTMKYIDSVRSRPKA